jgi:hypothetical protein
MVPSLRVADRLDGNRHVDKRRARNATADYPTMPHLRPGCLAHDGARRPGRYRAKQRRAEGGALASVMRPVPIGGTIPSPCVMCR